MGTAISNPASFSSVRSACSAEGYGSSTSLSAYTRGGGIVPNTGATASISTVAAGLALSQFSGVVIPSPVSHHTSSINQSTTSGSASTVTSGGAVSVTTTPATTVSTSGGVGPFTYSWSYVSGDTFTVNSPSSASTTFTRLANAPTVPDTFNTRSGVYRCTITDTGDASYQTTQDVTITTYHYYTP